MSNIESPIRSQIFISYSHKDKKWLERLQVHLKPLEREGLFERWDDTMINAGEKWRDEIRKRRCDRRYRHRADQPARRASGRHVQQGHGCVHRA